MKAPIARFLRDTRGAVFAEAAVMLPFFIIVWGCINFVHDYYSARITLSARAKTCAWQYANDGCVGALPPGCLRSGGSGDVTTSDLPDGAGSIVDDFAALPIVHGAVTRVLGQSANISADSTVARPPVLGGGTTALYSRHSVMCNELPRDPIEVARPAFCALTGLCR